MMGFLKVAKKHWPDCVISETHDAMDVWTKGHGELLVAARREGMGGMYCAKKETGAKYSLAVLQAPDNLKAEDKALAEKAAAEKAKKPQAPAAQS